MRDLFEICASRIIRILRWSERYTKTDMVYLASGNFWLTGGRIIGVASGMLLTLAFANLISPESFGTYKYILAIAGVAGAFNLSGLGGAVTRAVAQERDHVVPSVVRTAFVWSLPASAIVAVGSLYYFWQGNAQLGIGLALIASTNSFFTIFSFSKSIPLGKKDFKSMAVIGFPATVIPIALLIMTLYLLPNVIAILLVYFSSNFITGLLTYRYFIRKYHIEGRDEGVKETVQYGKHLSVMGAASQIVGYMDQLLLWHFAGPAQLAAYSFALAPVRELRNFSENIYPLVFPKFATKTIEEIKRTMPLRIKQLLLTSSAIAMLYIILSPLMYAHFFPAYISSILASQFLAAGLLLQPKGLVETVLYATGDTRIRYVIVMATQGSRMILWLMLIPIYGMLGAVIGTIISDIISATSLWWAYERLE